MKPTYKLPKEQQDNHCHQYFDSVWELAEQLRTKCGTEGKHGADVAGKNPDRLSSLSHSPSKHWDLNCGWDKAVTMAHEGWDEGAQKMDDILSRIESLIPHAEIEGEAAGLEYRFDEHGEEVDVGAYLAGDERPWLDPKLDATKPIVRIGVNVSASCGVPADAMMARGVMVAAIARYLERQDYATQIYIFEHGNAGWGGGQGVNTTTLFLKDSTEYLDPKKLAFWMAHPAVLRRLFFRTMEWSDVKLGGCYGTPADYQSLDYDIQSASAHLDRAQDEGWINDPAKAAECALESILDVIETRKQHAFG